MKTISTGVPFLKSSSLTYRSIGYCHKCLKGTCCTICELNEGNLIVCDSCGRALHKRCSGLNASEPPVMELKGS